MTSSLPVPLESDLAVRKTLRSNLGKTFLKGFIIPALVLVFFAIAPTWLNHRLQVSVVDRINAEPTLADVEKGMRIAEVSEINFAAVCRGAAADGSPRDRAVRADLEKAGIGAHFRRLDWGFRLSVVLMVLLLAVTAANLFLAQRARRSRAALIQSYRISWRLGIGAAVTKVFLLLPLMTYGLYELPALAMDRIFPQLILMIVLGGVIALWRSAVVLLKTVPMEFTEHLSREVTPEEAPRLWQAVRAAATRLKTSPPDHILVGTQLNFYVTELSVRHDSGRTDGRTLFLSHPLLKQLSPDEVLAIIGHELGHFIGEDTRITREFYPLRFKANATLLTLARSGWIGWTSVHTLIFSNWCFGAAEQAMSRERELMADRVAADLTSPETSARALVKFHVVNEAFRLGITGAEGRRLDNPFDTPLAAFIREQLVPRTAFWTELFETRTPHPLDSHPPLGVRLTALGQLIGPEAAMALATVETESAYDHWFSGREALFATLARQASEAIDKVRSRIDVTTADYQTDEGRRFLEKHFPEQRWRIRPLPFWLMVGVWALIVAALAAAVVLAEGAFLKLLMGGALLLAAGASVALWRRHRHGEYVLRADGLTYTGWNRPLRFSDVETLRAVNNHGSLSATFRLKTREPGIWKFSTRFRRRHVTVNLSWFPTKQAVILQTFHDYFTRQIKE